MRAFLGCFFFVVSLSSPFVTTWRTNSSYESITLPLTHLASNLTVDWGDGAIVNISTLPVTHTYNVSGMYSVSIVGDIAGFRFDNSGDKLKLIDVVSWGDRFFMNATSNNVFFGCSNLRVSASPNTQPVFLPSATLEGMFMNSSFDSPLNWDLANVTSVATMFQYATNFNRSLNFSNSQGVTDTSYMFYGASKFNSPVILDTTNVVKMSYMFSSAASFNQPVNFNTGNVQLMDGIFSFTHAFNQPINFNTSSLTQAKSMFARASIFNSPVTFTPTLGLNSTYSMFSGASLFNQPITFQTDNVVDMSYMFFSAVSFNQSFASNFNTGKVQNMGYMFSSTNAFNQPLDFDASNLQNAMYMFAGAIGFNSPVNFTNTSKLTNCDSMFRNASRFNRPLLLQTDAVTIAVNMFSGAASFNQPLNFNMSSLIDASNMFFNASSFNSTVNFITNPQVLKFTLGMFMGATSFNQPVVLQTDLVQDMSNMFSGASSFNQPLSFNTSGLQNANYMFQAATAFNSFVNFTSSLVLASVQGMFAGATSYNQPLILDTSTLLMNVDSMFSGAIAFNSLLNFTTTRGVTTFGSMFMNAVSFNQPVNFQTDSALDMHSMFFGATQFNQPVNFSTANVTSMEGMFCGAASFNQLIDFQANKLLSTANMFANAVSFNKPVVLRDTQMMTSMAKMFANVSNFNSTLNMSSTVRVTDMEFMFLNVLGFGQSLTSWSTDAVTKCDNFCEYCGLPSFPRCAPCGSSVRRVSQSRGSVCKCPSEEPNCEADICKLFRVSGSLVVDCLAPTPTPGSSGAPTDVIIISPLFNITQEDGNGSTFVFTLPIDPRAYTESGKVAYEQPCGSLKLSCEWQDPLSLEFRQSGCAVTKSMVDMGSGILGTECTCSHLTVFAIALRSARQLAPLCYASEVDYVLLSLYCLLAACLLIQLARLVWYKLYVMSKLSLLQHSLLLLACALRVAFIIAKPVIESLAGLVMLSLLPSAIALILFIYLMLAWTSLQLVTFSASPFARFRVPFATIAVAVLLLIIAVVIAVGMTKNERQSAQLEVVVSGSYVLAALYAVVCVLVFLAGLGLRRTLSEAGPRAGGASSTPNSHNSSPSSSPAALDWRAVFRWRVLLATLGLSSCLLVSACLWAAAVQADIIISDAATLGTTASFYVSDWLSLCVLTWLLSSAIGAAARKQNTRTKQSRQSRSEKPEN